MSEDDSDPKAARVSEAPPEPQPTEYTRHPIYSPSEWLLESISSVLALGMLVAIAAIFSYMDNKPLSAWRGYVSLNATISILTTACTTALMHGVSTFIAQFKWLHFRNGPHKLADFETIDGASRGVWGSILLLINVKWNLATIGAFVTILRLAFAPFAQQVVLIEQRDIISPADTVTFGYAHNYSRDILRDMANSGSDGVPQDPSMQSAVLRGLYDINTTEPFKCPGACRWAGPYISLGFRTQCSNVTQETLQTAACEGSLTGLRQCNMTTPGGLGLATRHMFTESATAFNMNASAPFLRSLANGLKDPFPEITRFAIYRSTPDSDFYMRDINVTQCSLFLTVYEYSGANANGSNFAIENPRAVDFGVKNPWTLGSSPAGYPLASIYVNETTSGETHIPALEISVADLLALGSFFESTTIVTEWVEGNFVNTNLGVAAALMGDIPLDQRFNAMATAMTEYLRYGPNGQLASGEIITSEPYISIRWGYFVVPIVTEAFAVLFAVLSILSNRRSRRVPLWKSSTLAVLACRHEERLGLLQTTGKDVNELQNEAEKTEARLG